MSSQAEILFLAHRIPYPPDKGDKIRSWRLVEHLAKRFSVHLAAFVDDPADLAHDAFLRGVCESVYLERLHPAAAQVWSARGFLTGEPLSFAYFRSASMTRQVAKLRSRPLVAEFAFSSAIASYLETAHANRPRLVDICDADSEKWRDYARVRRGPMKWIYQREADRVAAMETRIVGWADAAFAVSAGEAEILRARSAAGVRILGNGVDTDYFAPMAQTRRADGAADVVFIGAMDYAANVDAALWFANEVWPDVRAGHPTARFAVIGPRPTAAIKALAMRHGVSVVGRVDDVRPWLQQSRAVVAPLRIARGVPNKVLEAMAMSRPVVATSVANAAIGAAPGSEIVIADAAQDFARAVIGILKDNRQGTAIGVAARERVLSDFQWPTQLTQLDSTLQELGVLR